MIEMGISLDENELPYFYGMPEGVDLPSKLKFYLNGIQQHMVRKVWVSDKPDIEVLGWIERVAYIPDENFKPQIDDNGFPVTIPKDAQERDNNNTDNNIAEITGAEKIMFEPEITRYIAQVKWTYDE